MFYLTTHSTHFIYGYMASDIWLRTILIVRKETRCRHIGYSYRLTSRVHLYAPSNRQASRTTSKTNSTKRRSVSVLFHVASITILRDTWFPKMFISRRTRRNRQNTAGYRYQRDIKETVVVPHFLNHALFITYILRSVVMNIN